MQAQYKTADGRTQNKNPSPLTRITITLPRYTEHGRAESKSMRVALYLLATFVLLPYVLLATAFIVLGHVLSGGTLLSLFDALLRAALWMIPWGLLAFAVAVFALLTLGLSDRLRWLGGLCLSLVACGCTASILLMSSAPSEPGQLLFMLPCLMIVIFGAWLAYAELRAAPSR
jgi:hypothetical protein